MLTSRMAIRNLMRLKHVSSSQLLTDKREPARAGGDAQKDGGLTMARRQKRLEKYYGKGKIVPLMAE